MEIISISFSDKSIKLKALLTEINKIQYLLTCIDYIFKEQIICIGVVREVPVIGLVNVLITHTFTKCGSRVDSTHALWTWCQFCVQKPAIMTVVFHGFHCTVQADVMIYLKLNHDCFLPCHYSLVILPYNTV
jgi:hypothetical protein